MGETKTFIIGATMGLLSIGDSREVVAKHKGTIISKVTDDFGNEVEIKKEEEREIVICVFIPDATQGLDVRLLQNRFRTCAALMNRTSQEYWNFQKELHDGFKTVTKKAEIKKPIKQAEPQDENEPVDPDFEAAPEEQVIEFKVPVEYDFADASEREEVLFAALEKAKTKLNSISDHLVLNISKFIKNILGADGNPVEFKVTVNGVEVRRTWLSLDETEKRKVSKLIKEVIIGPVTEVIAEGAELVETTF